MPAQNPQRFDVGIKGLIVGPDGILIMRQSDSGKWEIPGGRINIGEESLDQKEILKREIVEEVGSNFNYSIERIFSTSARSWDAGPRKGDYVFLVAFLCRYISGTIQISDEHTEYAWVTRDTVSRYNIFKDFLRMIEEYWAQS